MPLAPRSPPPQGLRQVRFLPDSVHRRRIVVTGEQRARQIQYRREEESVLMEEKNIAQETSLGMMRGLSECLHWAEFVVKI